MMILTTVNQTELGENFGLIVTAALLIILATFYFSKKFKVAKVENGPDSSAIEAVQDVFNSIFSEDRFKVLVEQCVESALNVIVKGSTKEQFIEAIKDAICDSLYNFVETEYPSYKLICSRENIEKLADAILDKFGFDEEKIEALYYTQVEKLNDKSEEEE